MPDAPISALSSDSIRTQSEFARECMNFFIEMVQLFGMPKSVGQIYGLLYASPVPLSFADIVDQLKISKGSASQGLQFLRLLGAINVAKAKGQGVWGKGEVYSMDAKSSASDKLGEAGRREAARRDYYEPELSLRKLLSSVLQRKITSLATTGGGRIARLRELAERDGHRREFYLDRVKQLETWRRRLKTALPVLSALLGPKIRQ